MNRDQKRLLDYLQYFWRLLRIQRYVTDIDEASGNIRAPLKIQSSPKYKAREKFFSTAYG